MPMYRGANEFYPDVPDTFINRINFINQECLNPVKVFWLIIDESNYGLKDFEKEFLDAIEFIESSGNDLREIQFNYELVVNLAALLSDCRVSYAQRYVGTIDMPLYEEELFQLTFDLVEDAFTHGLVSVLISKLKSWGGNGPFASDGSELIRLNEQELSGNKQRIIWMLYTTNLYQKNPNESNANFGHRICELLGLGVNFTVINWPQRGCVEQNDVLYYVNLYKTRLSEIQVATLSDLSKYPGVGYNL